MPADTEQPRLRDPQRHEDQSSDTTDHPGQRDEKEENLSAVAGILYAACIASFFWLVLILIIQFF